MSRLSVVTGSVDFPPTSRALNEPNGLLAIGGSLSIERLIAAYQRGIFPWYSPGEPVMWWSPSPRCVFLPNQFALSKSLRKFIKRSHWRISVNQCFEQVIQHCATVDDRADHVWITQDIQHAYTALHQAGFAHSIEVWDGEAIVGGLYGVAMGELFFAESMFSLQSNGSKIALARLVQATESLGLHFIDAQIPNPHLLSLGASFLARAEFERALPQSATPRCAQQLQRIIATDCLQDLLAQPQVVVSTRCESTR